MTRKRHNVLNPKVLMEGFLGFRVQGFNPRLPTTTTRIMNFF
jgi:hypothetical protein